MRKVILASHGSLAEGMYSAVKMIMVNCENISAYGLDTYGNPSDIYEIVRDEIIQHPEDEYIILCDINGGSVHSHLMQLCTNKNVYLIVGLTLGMVLEISFSSADLGIRNVLRKAITSSIENTLLYDADSVKKEIEKGLEDDALW